MVFRWKRGNNQKNRKSVINADLTPFESLDPERLFCRYDKDSSGKILFGEFKDMLVDLGIQITEAKAMKYFAGKISIYSNIFLFLIRASNH